MISIHVLRVEDDTAAPQCIRKLGISIHVLRVEDDLLLLSIWWTCVHFNPRPPCGGRRKEPDFQYFQHGFQSTSSVWRTTAHTQTIRRSFRISIHVLRVEDDRLRSSWRSADRNFNPRPPCGGRRSTACRDRGFDKFQSTSSVWRTTRPAMGGRSWVTQISIHVLRVEDDLRTV